MPWVSAILVGINKLQGFKLPVLIKPDAPTQVFIIVFFTDPLESDIYPFKKIIINQVLPEHFTRPGIFV